MRLEELYLRDFQTKDIHLLMDYWFRSPPGFVESMGVDLAKIPSEENMRDGWKKLCAENELVPSSQSQMRCLAVVHDGHAVGVHLINNLVPGDSAIFHAHFWDAASRGKGIGTLSYPLACEIFFKRFNLKKLLFKTPLQNTAAIRLKEKLGIRSTGEEKIDFGIIKAGTLARCFELEARELPSLLERARQISISRK